MLPLGLDNQGPVLERSPPLALLQQHPSLWDKGAHPEPAGSRIHSLTTLELPGSPKFSGYLDIPVPAARASAGLSPIRNPGLRAGMMERLGWQQGYSTHMHVKRSQE